MKLHGCHNLPREGKPLLVQDGWIDMGMHPNDAPSGRREKIRVARMVEIPFVNSIDCRHDKRFTDPGCTDCIHGTQ